MWFWLFQSRPWHGVVPEEVALVWLPEFAIFLQDKRKIDQDYVNHPEGVAFLV